MNAPERLANEFDPSHTGPWSTRCPRCGTQHPSGAVPRFEYEPVTQCSLCRLPNPTPAGFMLPQHDDPEGLL